MTRAIAAAQAVAREHGVGCDDAVRLASGSNVLVHLRPAPVVARVMTATAVLHDDLEEWLTREVAVGVFLAERTEQVVAPTNLLPPGPYERDGLWLTLWEFVEHGPHAAPDAREVGRSLRELHAVLAAYPGELAPLSAIRDWLARLIDRLPDSGALRARLDALTPTGLMASAAARGLEAAQVLAGYGAVEGVESFLEAHALYDVVWQTWAAKASARA
jgi:hypothetical protein